MTPKLVSKRVFVDRLDRIMAGYRNRLVHFYHDVSRDELFEICAGRLTDLEVIAEAFPGRPSRATGQTTTIRKRFRGVVVRSNA